MTAERASFARAWCISQMRSCLRLELNQRVAPKLGRQHPPERASRGAIEPKAKLPQRFYRSDVLAIAASDNLGRATFVEQPIDDRATHFDGVPLAAAAGGDGIADLNFISRLQRRLKPHV